MVSTLCCGFKKLLGSSHSSNLDEGYPSRDEYAISSKFEFMWITIQYILRIWGDKFMLCSIDSIFCSCATYSRVVQYLDAFDGVVYISRGVS